jgi:hypothetical protein
MEARPEYPRLEYSRPEYFRLALSQIGMYRLHRQIDRALEEGILRVIRVLSGIAACVLIAGSVWLVKSRSATVENATPSAPPWADVARADIETPTAVYSTPAAVWYLSDDSSRAEEPPQAEAR